MAQQPQLRTRLTELFGIRYPIVCGGMAFISRAEFVAEICNAGALGIVAAATFNTAEELRQEIRRTRQLTDQPFGVNITLIPSIRPIDIDGFFNLMCEEKVPVVETSGRSPADYIPMLSKGGVKVIHKIGSARHAASAERGGVASVIALGWEGAGHPLMDDVTGLVLIPRVADSVSIPVIAGGGFADGRGLMAALALGASGVVMGTRFMLTKEAPASDKFKQALLKKQEMDTIMIQRSIQNQTRVLRNEVSLKVAEMESKGAKLEELIPYIRGDRGRTVYEGDLEAGTLTVGQGIGLIDDVPTVKELVERIVTEALEVRRSLPRG
jgi:NAD(P)H-dependent flavin oxidoreductase YrpB (nitropropane dioxygenase family)